ncbi:MAG TPA: isoprenylcysteine carboxylmethyltransferase family protein [Candidatus Kapabacteria bacterium]|nr:isoprenylcysteine carboxylmethyltransferase family protein [Candidatus Kapabacteria bacterium]
MKEKLQHWLFTNRSYTPIPFLILLLIIGRPTWTWVWVGLAMLIAGELIRIYSVGYAGLETRATSDVGAPRLVTAGPYGHVRNPLYVGNILMYTGIGVMGGIWWLPLLGLLWFGFQYYMIVEREQSFLRREFGAEYQTYCEHVPAFFPRITPWRGGLNAVTLDVPMALRSEKRSFQSLSISAALVIASGFIKGSLCLCAFRS